ncbi:MAG: hypothetical protein K2O54_03960 [Prevotella sp.]|nr:hypothetical protein [Prevotella sp.]
MRLIDADALKEDVLKNPEKLFMRGFYGTVDAQPTVFDIEKVKERSREEIRTCLCEKCDKHTDCDTYRAEKAVEIVKEELSANL